ERNGLTVEHRTGLLFLPGIVRLADLFLHVRGMQAERVMSAAARPFAYAERRWEWARRLGYLVAGVARKGGHRRTRLAPGLCEVVKAAPACDTQRHRWFAPPSCFAPSC